MKVQLSLRGVLAGVAWSWVIVPVAGAQAIGPEFRVNSYTPGTQLPSVAAAAAAAADGRFVVTWSSRYQDGSGWGIFGRRYDSTGSPVGPEFRANSYTTGDQVRASVAAAADGRFVVTWTSVGQDGSGGGAFGQRYDAKGLPAGPEFRVNSYIHPLCRGRSCFQAGAARPPLLYSAPAFAFEQWRGSP
jgi:hypothetical protein